MMLEALVEFAEREGLGDPDFEPAEIDWVIPLDFNGALLPSLIDLRTAPKRVWAPTLEQDYLTVASQPRARFLCDNLERSTGWCDANKPERANRAAGSLAFFRQRLRDCAQAVPADASYLAALSAFLDQPQSLAALHHRLSEAKAKPNQLATFTVDGVDLLTLPGPKAFWRQWRDSNIRSNPNQTPRACLASGKFGATLQTTGTIKGVPGGNPSGTKLFSFDKDAFCSFGLDQAQNSPISSAAELKTRSALNALIEKSRGQKLVFNDTIWLHWSRWPIDFDPVDVLASPEPEAVANLLQSVAVGRGISEVDANAYYAALLSGNGSRIVVRDWVQSSVPEVARNVAQWFSDLAIVDSANVIRSDFKLFRLLATLLPAKGGKADFKKLPPQLPTMLFHAAIAGAPIPDVVLAAALRRQQLADQKCDPARIALVKAALLRQDRFNMRKEKNNVSEQLVLESHDPAYLCGRLFAVFERLQLLALGELNAGVAVRFYAAASVTPALVMGRLFRNAQFHLAKAGGGAAENVRKEIETIAAALSDRFPATLDLESQGRFALGYYHQRCENRRRASERKSQTAGAVAGL